MRANEFINEAGWLDKIKSAAAHAAKGAGLLKPEEFAKIMHKLEPAKFAANAATVLKTQMARINKQAEAQGIDKASDQYMGAVEQAVKALFKNMRIDTSNPTFKKAIDSITQVAISDPNQLDAAVKRVAELMIKISQQDYANTGARGLDDENRENRPKFGSEILVARDIDDEPTGVIYSNEFGNWSKWERSVGGNYEFLERMDDDDINKIEAYITQHKAQLQPAVFKRVKPNFYDLSIPKGPKW